MNRSSSIYRRRRETLACSLAVAAILATYVLLILAMRAVLALGWYVA